MHFQKLLPVICVTFLVSAGAMNVRATDTDAQARARELLRQKMSDLDSQKGSANPSNSAPAAAPAPVPKPAPTPTPPPAPAPTTPPPATAQQPAAQQPNFSVTATGSQPLSYQWKYTGGTNVAPVQAQPAQSARPASGLTPEQLQMVLDAERSEKARLDAADRSAAATAVQQKGETSKSMKSKEAMPVAPANVAVRPASQPAETFVPSTLSGTKEQKLNELLERYKADKITPYEYHQERAKILAE